MPGKPLQETYYDFLQPAWKKQKEPLTREQEKEMIRKQAAKLPRPLVRDYRERLTHPLAKYKSTAELVPTPEHLARQVEQGKCVTIPLTPEQNEMLCRYWEAVLPGEKNLRVNRKKNA